MVEGGDKKLDVSDENAMAMRFGGFRSFKTRGGQCCDINFSGCVNCKYQTDPSTFLLLLS